MPHDLFKIGLHICIFWRTKQLQMSVVSEHCSIWLALATMRFTLTKSKSTSTFVKTFAFCPNCWSSLLRLKIPCRLTWLCLKSGCGKPLNIRRYHGVGNLYCDICTDSSEQECSQANKVLGWKYLQWHQQCKKCTYCVSVTVYIVKVNPTANTKPKTAIKSS